LAISELREVKTGFFSEQEVSSLLQSDIGIALIEHKHNPLLLGRKALLKVNTNIGVSDSAKLDIELKKLEALLALDFAPDSMMDHTYVPLDRPLWKYMIEMLDRPIGTLPHYATFSSEHGIDKNELLEAIDEMGQGGVSFMTLHPTSQLSLLEIAKSCRSVPTTSRGGVLILRDAQINKRTVNVMVDCFDDILALFKKHSMTLSVGTTFRPARIDEALDAVQLEEIKLQGTYVAYAKSKGVSVIMEGVGHLALDDIEKYCNLICEFNVPLMPLGPMPTDATVGFDHVSSAIGATVIGMLGNIGSINSVTREEHTGGVPNMDSIIEGLKAARVVAHAINLTRFTRYREIDTAIADSRATAKTCAISGGIFGELDTEQADEGCSRCNYECPLILLK